MGRQLLHQIVMDDSPGDRPKFKSEDEPTKFFDLYPYVTANIKKSVAKTGELDQKEEEGINLQALGKKLEIVAMTADKKWWYASLNLDDYKDVRVGVLKGARGHAQITKAFTGPFLGMDAEGKDLKVRELSSIRESDIEPCPKDVIFFGVSYAQLSMKHTPRDDLFEEGITMLLETKLRKTTTFETFPVIARPYMPFTFSVAANPQVRAQNPTYTYTRALRVVRKKKSTEERLEYWDGSSPDGLDTPFWEESLKNIKKTGPADGTTCEDSAEASESNAAR